MDSFVTETRTWTAEDAAQLLISHNALTELTQEEALEVVRLEEDEHVRFRLRLLGRVGKQPLQNAAPNL